MKIKQMIITGLFIVTMVSCGWKASDQDIKTMEETRTAALKAEGTKNKKTAELRKLKQEVEAAKARKTSAEKELTKVKTELAKRAGN